LRLAQRFKLSRAVLHLWHDSPQLACDGSDGFRQLQFHAAGVLQSCRVHSTSRTAAARSKPATNSASRARSTNLPAGVSPRAHRVAGGHISGDFRPRPIAGPPRLCLIRFTKGTAPGALPSGTHSFPLRAAATVSGSPDCGGSPSPQPNEPRMSASSTRVAERASLRGGATAPVLAPPGSAQLHGPRNPSPRMCSGDICVCGSTGYRRTISA
jgi:hypothetical protein